MIKLLILATLFTLSVSPVRAELPLKAEAPIPGSSVKTEPPIKVEVPEVPSVSSAKTGLPIKGDVISINAMKTKPFHLKKLLRHIAMVPLVITEACCLGAAACPYGGYYGSSYAPAPTGFGYNSYSYNPTQGVTTTRIGDYYTGGSGYNSYSYTPAQGVTTTRIGSY
jgi:hypothetical protein